jgi:hypothetical protein
MIKTYERDQPNVWKIVTPKVLETVREQFACQDLNGAELENNVRTIITHSRISSQVVLAVAGGFRHCGFTLGEENFQ